MLLLMMYSGGRIEIKEYHFNIVQKYSITNETFIYKLAY